MAQVVWSNPALSDLNEIAEYIALDKPSAAKKLIYNVFLSIDRLQEYPELGRHPLEIKDKSYREIIVGPCRIFYRTENNNIFIVYVMRGERKLRKYILNEREDLPL